MPGFTNLHWQKNTLFGNNAATNHRIRQTPGNKPLILAIVRPQHPESGNNAATTGNKNQFPYQKQTINIAIS
jgi:hypothetical protein